MNEDMKKYGSCINIGDKFSLVYKSPEEFSKYHIIYHGQKYGQYYFRNSSNILSEKAKYIDSGYLIYKDNILVGGAFIKPNFMADLFIIPPFNEYKAILSKALQYLKSISDVNKEIFIQEVVEELVEIYEEQGCAIKENGYWMIRTTEILEAMVPEGYVARNITSEDKFGIADLIVAAYKANPAMKTVWDKDVYIEHVESFFEYTKNNEVLYKSSKVVVSKATNEIVGSCLHMEFEELPLIMSFAVSPEHQGKGIGSFMLRHSISCTTTRYNATRLYVDNNNSAMNIYKHLGFINNKLINDMILLDTTL